MKQLTYLKQSLTVIMIIEDRFSELFIDNVYLAMDCQIISDEGRRQLGSAA